MRGPKHQVFDRPSAIADRPRCRSNARDGSSGAFAVSAPPLRAAAATLFRCIVLGAVAWLPGCAVIGPTIPAAAGPGKSAVDWDRDQRECRAATDATLQPQANAMNGAATSTDQVAANNARIQQMYDADYGGCLTAHGV